MKKNELDVLKILAEIQDPNKRMEDAAHEIFKLGEERAVEEASANKQSVQGDAVQDEIDEVMGKVHDHIDALMKKAYGGKN